MTNQEFQPRTAKLSVFYATLGEQGPFLNKCERVSRHLLAHTVVLVGSEKHNTTGVTLSSFPLDNSR